MDTKCMWYLFFLLIFVFILTFPIKIELEIKMNILKLKGSFKLKVFKAVLDYKIRIKHGYVYINHKNKERKEKITDKNINIKFILNLISQVYFREEFELTEFHSNFGYIHDAKTTAVVTGSICAVTKSILGKIKNNKKLAHIFVDIEPKYNEDIFNVRLKQAVRISIFDLLYAFVLAKLYTAVNKNLWRNYEKRRKIRK